MQEIHCATCKKVLTSGLEMFGELGREQCLLCYLAPLDTLYSENDEYTQSVGLNNQFKQSPFFNDFE